MTREGNTKLGGPLPAEQPAASAARGLEPIGGVAPSGPKKSSGFGFPARETTEPTAGGRAGGLSRSGFSDAPGMRGVPGSAPAAIRPAPVPKRPKGRYFVGSLMSLLAMAGGYAVWNAFWRYEAYGIVAGRVVRVSAPWDGVLQTQYVQEGQAVRQGQLLATMENLAQQQKLARTIDDLRIAQASLQAELAKLQWQTQLRDDRGQKALAEYYELWGELLQEQSRLSDLQSQLARTKILHRRRTVTEKELESILFAEQGQRSKVEKLRSAVDELKKRARIGRPEDDISMAELKPELLQVEALQAEITRLHQQTGQGRIVSPVDGRIVQRTRFTGEFAARSSTLFEVLEEGSTEAVVYLPQSHADTLQVGDRIDLTIEPHRQPIACTVVRLGQRLQTPPANIDRYYPHRQQLVPVHARPRKSPSGRVALRLGSEVKLPLRWSRLIGGGSRYVPGAAEDENRPVLAADQDKQEGSMRAESFPAWETPRASRVDKQPTGVPAT